MAVEAPSVTAAWVRKPSLEHIDGRQHRVTRRGVYRAASGATYEIPRGFVTDGASVPRVLWALYPPFGDDYEPAAVLHDYVYAHAERFAGSDNGHLSRGEADALMLEAMAVDGFRASGRRTVWLAVRAGGWLTWRRHRARATAQLERI